MVQNSPHLEIEIDGPCNESLYFRPLSRSIRGSFDFLKVKEPMAAVASNQWPVVIPSQRIGIDPDGCGYIKEPLHDALYTETKEKIISDGTKLEPAYQEFDDCHLPTWQHWIKEAVRSGIARVTSGKLPKTIEGKPRLNFLHSREPGIEEKLTAALEKQNELLEKQTATFAKLIERLAK